MLRSVLILGVACGALMACEPVEAPEDTGPTVQLDSEEAQAVGLLAGQIADILDQRPRVQGGSSIQFLGARAEGTRVITDFQAPFQLSRLSSGQKAEIRRISRNDIPRSVCEATPNWGVFFSLGGSYTVRLLNPSRTVFDEVTITSCP